LGGDWNQLGGALTIAQNTSDTLSPEGKYNAGAITLSTASNRYFTSKGYNLGGLTNVSGSVWLKSDGADITGKLAFFNGTAGDVITITNQWQRFEINKTAANSTEYFGLDFRGSGHSTSGNVYCYGWQLENNVTYATSYIPTYGSAVTRNAEGCNKTGISSLIGQTEGTMFIEFDYKINSGNMRFSLSDNSGVNWIFIATPESGTSNASRFYIRANNVVQVDKGASSYFTLNERYKLAFAYKSGDWAIYGNGTLLYSGTDTFDSFTLPLQQVNFIQANGGTAGEKLPINQSLVFKTRLSNEELATLTTI
jgi:hypothetical protein